MASKSGGASVKHGVEVIVTVNHGNRADPSDWMMRFVSLLHSLFFREFVLNHITHSEMVRHTYGIKNDCRHMAILLPSFRSF